MSTSTGKAVTPFDHIDWTYALEFIDGQRRLLVVFDRDGYLGRSDRIETLAIAPKATGWREFFAEQEEGTGVRDQGSGVGKGKFGGEPSR